jgi:chorismate synthase
VVEVIASGVPAGLRTGVRPLDAEIAKAQMTFRRQGVEIGAGLTAPR